MDNVAETMDTRISTFTLDAQHAIKKYQDLLPHFNWSDLTIRSEIFTDIVAPIAFLQLRKKLGPTETAPITMIGKSCSLMCTKKKDRSVTIETPNKQVKNL